MILFLRQQRVFLYHITIGGGRRSLSDIKNILRLGADKVSINIRVIKNFLFIYEAYIEFCSTGLVVNIVAIKNKVNNHYAFIYNGREYTGLEVKEWAMKEEELGCGELIFTSVD